MSGAQPTPSPTQPPSQPVVSPEINKKFQELLQNCTQLIIKLAVLECPEQTKCPVVKVCRKIAKVLDEIQSLLQKQQ